MTVKELAEQITGREIGEEITGAEAAAAKEAGLVVVFGGSDDCTEFRGAIDDEVGCYEGASIYITKDGINEFAMAGCRSIEAEWHDEGDPCWTFETDIPHEVFEVFEDGELFCVGIVFCLDDLT